MIYEIKSGNDIKSLLNQIKKHYYFIEKYFTVFAKYNFSNFIYMGFIRDKNKINIPISQLNSFKKFNIPVIIMRFFDSMFGENIYYEHVEISDLAEIKNELKINTEKINKMQTQLNEFKNEFRNEISPLKTEISEIKNMLSNAFGQLNLLSSTNYNHSFQAQPISNNNNNIFHQNGFSENGHNKTENEEKLFGKKNDA